MGPGTVGPAAVAPPSEPLVFAPGVPPPPAGAKILAGVRMEARDPSGNSHGAQITRRIAVNIKKDKPDGVLAPYSSPSSGTGC